MSEQESSSKTASTARLALWLAFIAFLLIVTVFRSKISEIHFGGEGVVAKMANDADKLSPDDRKAAQDQLAQRVNTLEQEARSHADSAPAAQSQSPAETQSRTPATAQGSAQSEPATAPVSNAAFQQPQQPSLPNIAGAWVGANGQAYQVAQYGNSVVISELMYGTVDAAAAGQIGGWSFSLPSENVAGTTGVLSLTVSPDQRHMTGQYRDNVTGLVVPMYLNR